MTKLEKLGRSIFETALLITSKALTISIPSLNFDIKTVTHHPKIVEQPNPTAVLPSHPDKRIAAITPKESKGIFDWLATIAHLVAPLPKKREGILTVKKKAALRELLDYVGITNIVFPIVNGIVYQLKQMIPIIESDTLEKKPYSLVEKEKIMDVLKKYCDKGIEKKAFGIFQTDEFWDNAVRTFYSTYAKYYTLEEILDITSFYKSKAGKRYLEYQTQIKNEVLDHLIKKFALPALQKIRAEVEREVYDIMKGIKE